MQMMEVCLKIIRSWVTAHTKSVTNGTDQQTDRQTYGHMPCIPYVPLNLFRVGGQLRTAGFKLLNEWCLYWHRLNPTSLVFWHVAVCWWTSLQELQLISLQLQLVSLQLQLLSLQFCTIFVALTPSLFKKFNILKLSQV